MHFWVYISKPQKVVTLKYGEKAPTLGTFKVRHRGVNNNPRLCQFQMTLKRGGYYLINLIIGVFLRNAIF